MPMLSYVLPLRRQPDDPGLEELTDYLRWLSELVEVVVADGSCPRLYARHQGLWRGTVLHLPVVNTPGVNGKVAGVTAAMAAAQHEKVVIADDDVRYDAAGLAAMEEALDGAALIRPQNYFDPLPWHAAWDTGRILLNRALGSDSPGTLGVRRSFFLAMGGYDACVMYENLELVRTVLAFGGQVDHRPDLYVRRIPPTVRRFWEQRPRQAYDDFAQPAKLLAFLAALPTFVTLIRRPGGPARLATLALMAISAAEVGRRRHGGARVFPPTSAWWAPVWILERSVFSWPALAFRLSGGVPYSGSRLRVAAHTVRRLRRTTQTMTPVAQRSAPRAATAAQGYD